MNERVLKEVCDEVKLYQLNAMHILLDLQHSYRHCWIVHMTRRCAQMLLKYEAIAIIQLYETGMLEENEYSHILELIEKKLFSLEHGSIKMDDNRTKQHEDPIDLIPYFQLLSSTEKDPIKTLLTNKHKWFQPDSVLIKRNQRVSVAYLIIRGIIQYRDDTMSSMVFYKCGSIIGIDTLFCEAYLSRGTYMANGGLVEVYLIDSALLKLLLSDEKIARSIYNEIALHLIMNNFKKCINLTHSQLKMLLNDKAIFYINQTDLTIDLQINQRLFLLSGTISNNSSNEEIIMNSVCFILHDSPITYQLNSSSIIYTWTHEDEVYYSNIKKFKVNFPVENKHINSIRPFYPIYSGNSTEFSPRRYLSTVARPIQNTSNFRLIPSEIEVRNEQLPKITYF